MNLCEARSLLGRQPETRPLRRCASSSARSRRRARRGREAAVQTRPSRHLARLSLSTSQARGVSRKHSHLSGVSLPSMVASPPIQPAAKSSSWKLPMAGAAAPRPPGAGLVPIQRVRGMARGSGAPGRAAESRSAAPSDAEPGLQSPPAARAAALTSPPARRQLTARPQRSLKAQHAGGATARPAPPHSPGPEAPRPGEDSLRPPLYGDLSLASCRTSALRGEGAHSCL